MVGMIQILTYLLAFYLVLKGIEILQIALASGRPNRGGIVLFAAFVLVACILAAFSFVYMQDQQAMSIGTRSQIP